MATITKTIRERITPKQFGAKGNTRSLHNTSIETGSDIVENTVDAPFVPSDVGATIYLIGAGASGNTLAASVVEYLSATQVVISTVAITEQIDDRCVIGHDDTLAFTRAMAYISANAGFGGGSNLFLGDGHYLTGPLQMPTGASLYGNGPYQSVLYLKPGSALGEKYLVRNKTSDANHQAYEAFGLNGLRDFQTASDIDVLVWTAAGDTLTAVEGNHYRNLRIVESPRAGLRYDGLGDTKFTDITVLDSAYGFDINAPGNSFSGCSASAFGPAWLLGSDTKANRFVSCKGFLSGYAPLGSSPEAGDRANWYLNGASQNDFSSCEGQESWGSNWVLKNAKGNTFASCRGSDPGCVHDADGLGDDNSAEIRAGWRLSGSSSDTRFAACSVSVTVHSGTSFASHALYLEGTSDYIRGDLWYDMDPEMSFDVSAVGNTSSGENNTEIKVNGSSVYVAPIITSSNAASNSHNTALAFALTADQTVNWTLTGGPDLNDVELVGSTLRWTGNGTKDFEEPADVDGNNTYIVQVTATNPVSSLSTTQTITISVTLDVAPVITSANSASVAENSTLAHALVADQTVVWAITGGADAARFNISGSTLRWTGNGTKDFESPNDADTNNIYAVQVTATNSTSGLSSSQTINVTVTDVFDVVPSITSTNTASIAEGSVLAKALTSNQTVVWSITGGADQSQFDLSGATLRWAGNGVKDFESPNDADGNNTYVVQVTATNATTTLSVAQIITVTVTDILDVVPTITSTNSATVNENAQLTKALTSNQTVTWTLVGGQDQSHFELNGSTLRWTGNGTKDYESPTDVGTNNTYQVTVRATNAASLYAEQAITVTVADVLDVAPVITSSNVVSVAENVTLIKVLAANQSVTWSIVGGADQAQFELGGDTLRWLGNVTKDYENPNDADTNNVYSVVVRATNATTTMFTDQTITVTVTDVLDVGPVITSTNTASVAENATLSKALTANQSVTWTLSGGTDQAHFEISGSNLRWTGNGTKNFESPNDSNTNNTYVVQVTATNSASLASNQTITVTVTDVVEGPPPTITSASSANVAENTQLSHALTANQTVVWAIDSGSDQAHFEINGSTLRWISNGTKSFSSPQDADTNNTYVVTVRATNTEVALSSTQTITITVTTSAVFEDISMNVPTTGQTQIDAAILSEVPEGNEVTVTVPAGSPARVRVIEI